jgi:hypothetical protein
MGLFAGENFGKQLLKIADDSAVRNCTKTLCNCDLGAYFEREADSPKLLKTLKT